MIRRLRNAGDRGRAAFDVLMAPIKPDVSTPEGQREAITLYGLVLVGVGFAIANLLPLALIVPGTVLALVGLGLTFRRR